MADYINEKCISCGKEFTKDDDVVVCPECGTPYHRGCYEKEGKCINNELHEKHSVWKPEVKEHEETEKIVCKNCGAENPKEALFCNKCGTGLQYDDIPQDFIGIELNPNEECFGFNPDEDFDGVKLSEIAKYVKSNRLYFISHFKRMKDTGKKFSMNLLCIFFPQFFFANRKCYGWSFFTVLLISLISIPNIIVQFAEAGVMSELLSAVKINSSLFSGMMVGSTVLNYISIIFFGLFGNYIYYKHVIKNIKRIKAEGGQLETSGGTKFINVIFVIMLQIIFELAFIFIYSKLSALGA